MVGAGTAAIPTDQKLYDKVVAKVKARVARWPSAYASGQVVQEYKAEFVKKYNSRLQPYIDHKPDAKVGIARWFHENWIDIATGKPCGAVKNPGYYPTCRPAKRVTKHTPVTANELTALQKKAMIAEKQKAQTKTVQYKETRQVRKH